MISFYIYFSVQVLVLNNLATYELGIRGAKPSNVEELCNELQRPLGKGQQRRVIDRVLAPRSGIPE
jgi:hypothetical protein